jgi:hypothetical protein
MVMGSSSGGSSWGEFFPAPQLGHRKQLQGPRVHAVQVARPLPSPSHEATFLRVLVGPCLLP